MLGAPLHGTVEGIEGVAGLAEAQVQASKAEALDKQGTVEASIMKAQLVSVAMNSLSCIRFREFTLGRTPL